MDLYFAFVQLNYTHGYTGFWTHSNSDLISLGNGYTGLWTHSYSDLISLERIQVHYSMNSTTDNADFVHPVAYMCESAAELRRDSNPKP